MSQTRHLFKFLFIDLYMFNLRYGKMINNSEKEINKFVPKISNLDKNTSKKNTMLTKLKNDKNFNNSPKYNTNEKNEI